jgi:hypothetical protein
MIEGLRPYAEYKASGIPWACSLPSDWKTERAKRLFRKMDRPVRPEDEVVTCFRDGMVTLRKNRLLVKAFNDQFGGLFADPKRMEDRLTGEIPKKVSADTAYQNAKKNSDRQNARIEHDKAFKRVITALFTDDAQLFKQFQDNDSFRRWLTDTVFGMTYET